MKFSYLSIVLIFAFSLTIISVRGENLKNKLDFEVVEITPFPDNNLRAIASVTLTDTANVYFRYKNTLEDSTDYIYTKISELNKNHVLTLTNLKQSTNYKIEAIAFNKNNFVTLDTFSFKTSTIDSRLDNFENYKYNGFYNTPQYTITNLPSGPQSYFIITDLYGNLVWYHKYNLEYNSCNAWRLTSKNTILYASCKEIVELDLDGNVLRNIVIDEPDWYLHHDVQYLSNGDLAVIYAHPETVFTSSTGEEIVIVDGYLIFNEQNELVYNWKASDFFDASEAKFMGGYWSSIFMQRTLDWCHFNSIAEDFDNNILISSSHWSKVFKVNRFTGDVIWELGEDGTLQKDSTFKILRQHSIEPIAPHKYLLFDNLGNDWASRAVEFSVDPNINFAFSFWQYVPTEKITSPTRGNVQRLPNGNTLVFFPTVKGYIHEVTPNGELIWEIDVIKSGYRTYRLPYLTEPHKQVLIEINDTICSSETFTEIITQPKDAYVSGEAVQNGQLLTEGLAGTVQTITATYGNNVVEKNVVIAAKEDISIELNDSFLQVPNIYETYQWYFNDLAIENETNATFTPIENGQYFVAVQNKYGCINYSDTLNYIKTSLSNFEEQIQYNINNKLIEISLPNNGSKNIEIFTLDGKLLFSKQFANQTISIPMQQHTGIFIMKIESNKTIYTKKIIL